MKTFIRSYDNYNKALKEGISIYELEDDTVDEPQSNVADLDADTKKAEESTDTTPAPAEPTQDEPEVQEEPKKSDTDEDNLDMGHQAMNKEEFNTKLQFVQDMLNQYKKYLSKDSLQITDGMKKKISTIFKIMSE